MTTDRTWLEWVWRGKLRELAAIGDRFVRHNERSRERYEILIRVLHESAAGLNAASERMLNLWNPFTATGDDLRKLCEVFGFEEKQRPNDPSDMAYARNALRT